MAVGLLLLVMGLLSGCATVPGKPLTPAVVATPIPTTFEGKALPNQLPTKEHLAADLVTKNGHTTLNLTPEGYNLTMTIKDAITIAGWTSVILALIFGVGHLFNQININYSTTAIFGLVGAALILPALAITILFSIFAVAGVQWYQTHTSTVGKLESDAVIIWRILVTDVKGLYVWLSVTLQGFWGWIISKFKKAPTTTPSTPVGTTTTGPAQTTNPTK